jgi:uncharacterized membrane protein YbhN (UPF0104 family)
MPDEVSPRRVRRGLVRLGALIAFGAIVITLLPGLGSLRHRFDHANGGWIAAAVVFELLSTLAYVPAFRSVFCTRMRWGTSAQIALSEEAANSLLPVGGAGGLALGVWVLRRGGVPAAEIGRKTVAFFLLTSVPNVLSLGLVGVLLAVGVLPGDVSVALGLVPAAVAVGAVAIALAVGRLTGRLAESFAAVAGSRRARIAPALRAGAEGVREALRLLRAGDPWLLIGIWGYMVFDILVLWVSYRALGASPGLWIVWMAYVIGQLGNLVPLPGGIGGVELGLVGTLALYGLPALTSTAAVLIYRAIELWIPAFIGAAAFVKLRRMVRDEATKIDLCQPGEVVDVIGQGAVVPKPVTG